VRHLTLVTLAKGAVREAHGVVRALPFAGDDAALVTAIRAGHPGATTALFDRYGAHVRSVLARLIGLDTELADLLHDVFVAALDQIDQLKDASVLKGWLTTIAVFTARGTIRKRARWRWLRIVDEPPDVPVTGPSHVAREAVRRLYAVLDRLSPDDRIAFALRFVQGMELTEVAAACDVSLATIKRRLAKAEVRFVELARGEPALVEWMEGGTRWS
jgi:RNA polymerase sigma-70 factor, ECF subfamily